MCFVTKVWLCRAAVAPLASCLVGVVTYCSVMFRGIGTVHPSGFGVHRWKKAAAAHDWQKQAPASSILCEHKGHKGSQGLGVRIWGASKQIHVREVRVHDSLWCLRLRLVDLGRSQGLRF